MAIASRSRSETTSWRMAIPAVRQVADDGSRIERPAEWWLDGEVLRAIPQDWDRTLPGVVDPTLEWATYLGGGAGGEGNEEADGVAVDSSGNAYVTGVTSSSDFPTTVGVHDTTLGPPRDRFVVKMDPAGVLLYGTFVDGPIEWAYEQLGIAVDSGGNVYITGAVAAGAPGSPGAAGCLRLGRGRCRALRGQAGRRRRSRLRRHPCWGARAAPRGRTSPSTPRVRCTSPATPRAPTRSRQAPSTPPPTAGATRSSPSSTPPGARSSTARCWEPRGPTAGRGSRWTPPGKRS